MQRTLDGGLILRTLSEGHAGDCERLPQFYADVNGEGDTEEEKEGLRQWTEDLIHRHPTTTLDDIFVVVDPAHDDRIASATLLIPQTWRYEEIPFAVGRPELVGTLPDYRRRGLVRALMEAVHARSAALGHHVQAITGIPHFYRAFGYTMALDLGPRASLALTAFPERAPDAPAPFTLRPATVDDIPRMAAWHEWAAHGRLLTDARSPAEWKHTVAGHSPASVRNVIHLLITNPAGEDVGFVELYTLLSPKSRLDCGMYVVGENASYLETYGDVVRGIRQWAAARYGECPALLYFESGLHPGLERLIERSLGGAVRTPYAWYLRVADTVAFLQQIAPMLERRLEHSAAHGYSGDFAIGFYDLTGIRMTFARGRLSAVAPMQGKDGYDISFPWHLFWNAVFGYGGYDEMRAVLPDVYGSGKGVLLLETLFPRKRSWIEGMA